MVVFFWRNCHGGSLRLVWLALWKGCGVWGGLERRDIFREKNVKDGYGCGTGGKVASGVKGNKKNGTLRLDTPCACWVKGFFCGIESRRG